MELKFAIRNGGDPRELIANERGITQGSHLQQCCLEYAGLRGKERTDMLASTAPVVGTITRHKSNR